MVRHPCRITKEKVFSELELPLGVLRRAAALNHRLVIVVMVIRMAMVMMVMIARWPMSRHKATTPIFVTFAPSRATRKEALDALSVVF